MRQNRQEGFRVMVRAIQIGMQDGSINNTYDPNELAILLWATSHGVVNTAYMHQNTEHFKLLDHLGIDMETMFKSYMKLIGCGIQSESNKNSDSQSFLKLIHQTLVVCSPKIMMLNFKTLYMKQRIGVWVVAILLCVFGLPNAEILAQQTAKEK